jgi:histidyl-tRNA synthetase
LEELDLFPKTLESQPRFLFLNFGEEAAACSFEYLMKLRGEGIVSEFYPTASKLKKQFIYANQRSIPFVIMIGSEEFKNKHKLSTHPNRIYEDEGWIGWKDFLGNE